ncbi:hypothetical protein DFH09DRAFT_1367429 [Mycena vulgaris]|nr:hypothetical protein DFH09DRAFT_1374295 [Mycena vulgaris]KAJ6546274.1 hypothetical protein DFH09DRAFT_1367429 [Mycena vulgaris]
MMQSFRLFCDCPRAVTDDVRCIAERLTSLCPSFMMSVHGLEACRRAPRLFPTGIKPRSTGSAQQVRSSLFLAVTHCAILSAFGRLNMHPQPWHSILTRTPSPVVQAPQQTCSPSFLLLSPRCSLPLRPPFHHYPAGDATHLRPMLQQRRFLDQRRRLCRPGPSRARPRQPRCAYISD